MSSKINGLADRTAIELAREPAFRLGSAEVRPAIRELLIGGDAHLLEPRVMQVLVALARANGEVLTRDDLIVSCWEGRIVGEDAINRVISKLHRLSELDDGGAFQLQTIRGVGYRLTPAAPTNVPSRDLVDSDRPAAAAAPNEPAAGSAISPTLRRRPIGRAMLALGLAGVVLASLGAAALVWTARRPPPSASVAAEPLTLAVLPFDNLVAAPASAFVADGLAREVRNRLSRVRGLRVIADSSSFAVAEQRMTATEMGERLGADLLLDGSVRQTGDSLRVTTELIDARSGIQVWEESRDHPADDLARVQEAVSVSVIQQLIARLGAERVQILAAGRERNPAALRLILQAEQDWETMMTRMQQGRIDAVLELGKSVEQRANQALAIDPEDPGALLMLARLHGSGVLRASDAPEPPPDARRQAATRYARAALAADPNEPGALTQIAESARRDDWRWRESELLFRRALAVDPNHVDAHGWYTYFLSTEGRCKEALVHARTARRLDPEFVWRGLAVPRVLYCLGRHAEAHQLYREAMTQDRDSLFLIREVYMKRFAEGDPAALRELERFVRSLWPGSRPSPPVEQALARLSAGAEALEGRPTKLLALIEAEAALQAPNDSPENYARRNPDIIFMLAIEAAGAGRPGLAVELLERAVAGGSIYIPDALPYGQQEFTSAVRADPRYQAIWLRDPRLVELAAVRLQSLKARQMRGRLPDGRMVEPDPD